jgi:RNA polymerase sigma factor, sigma-70 family
MNYVKDSKTLTNNYSDEELLILVSDKDENRTEAQQAFTIFYNRYKTFLWNLCVNVCRKCKKPDDEELAKDLFQNTMISVYAYGHTFNSKKSKVTTWLSRIAKNELYRLLRNSKELRIDEEMELMVESVVDEKSANGYEFESSEQKVLKEALEFLPEREQEILLTYIMYEDGNKQLPKEIRQYLLDKYATTQENLRQIKGRSLKKIKDIILNKNKLSINQ